MSRDTEPPRNVNGPEVPGAQEKPRVKKAPPIVPKRIRKPKIVPTPSIKILKIQRLKELIEPLTPSLIQIMSDIAHDKAVHAAVRLDAAERLLNRLYGKPTEKVELTEPEENRNGDEVKTLLNNILESVGAPKLEFHDDPEASQERYAPEPSKGEK